MRGERYGTQPGPGPAPVSDNSRDGVVVTSHEGVLRIVIDRRDPQGLARRRRGPAHRRRALESASTDDSLRAVLLTSSGPDFCSGSDWVSSNA